MLLKFPTVYKDSISEEPMAGNPVRIPLKENAVPYRVLVARQIPLRFQDQTYKTIQHLLDSKIINKCDTPSAYGAHRGFLWSKVMGNQSGL